MNIVFALMFITILNVNCSPQYILTPKMSKMSKMYNKNSIYKVQTRKVNGKANIGNNEYIFASNLSVNEIKELSQYYYVEPNKNMTINWHLDRIDQKRLPLSKTPYQILGNNKNIDIYIVDTGIDITHKEFVNNNIIWGNNFVDTINTDCSGHGTHVASLAAGKKYGVAKGANLIAVKVLGCNGVGSYSGIISAIEWIINRSKTTGRISIINMSLSGPSSIGLDTVIKSAFDNGIYVVVAAGNSNKNACDYSPARLPEAITVAATQSNDSKASFSNYGQCVDVYAPGVNIVASWPGNKFAGLSGTSMASPVACGVLAIYLSKYGRNGYDMFFSNMTLNIIKNNPALTPNKLVFINKN